MLTRDRIINADVRRRLIVITGQEQSMNNKKQRNEQQLFEIKVNSKQSEFNLTHTAARKKRQLR